MKSEGGADVESEGGVDVESEGGVDVESEGGVDVESEGGALLAKTSLKLHNTRFEIWKKKIIIQYS